METGETPDHEPEVDGSDRGWDARSCQPSKCSPLSTSESLKIIAAEKRFQTCGAGCRRIANRPALVASEPCFVQCSTSNIQDIADVVILRSMMNPADGDRIHELCSMIAVEQNREKFLELVKELNRILEAKDERFQNERSPGVPE